MTRGTPPTHSTAPGAATGAFSVTVTANRLWSWGNPDAPQVAFVGSAWWTWKSQVLEQQFSIAPGSRGVSGSGSMESAAKSPSLSGLSGAAPAVSSAASSSPSPSVSVIDGQVPWNTTSSYVEIPSPSWSSISGSSIPKARQRSSRPFASLSVSLRA